MDNGAQNEVAVGDAAEHRVRLLQSEIKVRDQIATLKQRLDMYLLRLEQQALSDLRALTGQEMLAIKKRESRLLAQDCDRQPERLARVLTFDPNQVLERLESEMTDLGSVSLIADSEDETDAVISTAEAPVLSEDSRTIISSSISDLAPSEHMHQDKHLQTRSESNASRATSGFVQVGRDVGPVKSGQTSESSSYCFVETGTLSRRLKKRSSILERSEIFRPLKASDEDSTTPKEAKHTNPKLEGTPKEPEGGNIVFTVLKDNTIVTIANTTGTVTLYGPDFVLLSTMEVSTPLAICHHVAYDVIAILSREDGKDFVVLLKTCNNNLEIMDKLAVRCQGRVSCMTYSSSKLYLGCNGNHIHVIDENWKEKQLSHAPIGQNLISIATNEVVFSLVGSDGSVTYVDSVGRYLSKDSINAISVGFISGKPFVLCRDNGIKVVETSPTEEEVTEPKVVIKTGLRDVLDMHVSTDNEEVAILYRNDNGLDITKFQAKPVRML